MGLGVGALDGLGVGALVGLGVGALVGLGVGALVGLGSARLLVSESARWWVSGSECWWVSESACRLDSNCPMYLALLFQAVRTLAFRKHRASEFPMLRVSAFRKHRASVFPIAPVSESESVLVFRFSLEPLCESSLSGKEEALAIGFSGKTKLADKTIDSNAKSMIVARNRLMYLNNLECFNSSYSCLSVYQLLIVLRVPPYRLRLKQPEFDHDARPIAES